MSFNTPRNLILLKKYDHTRWFSTEERIFAKKPKRNLFLAKVNRFSFTETTKRTRRQLPGINKLCPGGMNYAAALEQCYPPRLKCRVQTKTCYKFVYCDYGSTPPSVFAMSVRVARVDDNCNREHIYVNIVCCEYVCNQLRPRPIALIPL